MSSIKHTHTHTPMNTDENGYCIKSIKEKEINIIYVLYVMGNN